MSWFPPAISCSARSPRIFLKFDKSRLPNLANAWPVVTERLAIYDPDNSYGANYMWGTTGIGYNVKMAQKLLGPDAKIDSWDIVFEPDNLAKFKDCGIHMLDSADDILPAALSYLGSIPIRQNRPISKRPPISSARSGPMSENFIPPNILARWPRRDLLRGGLVGRHHAGAKPRGGGQNGIEIGYAIPKEGAQMFFDNLAIPADAKNVAEAYELINYLYRPDVAAKNSDFLSYANGNLASQKLIDPKIFNDKNIYPDEGTHDESCS